jgi:hypothetical protein
LKNPPQSKQQAQPGSCAGCAGCAGCASSKSINNPQNSKTAEPHSYHSGTLFDLIQKIFDMKRFLLSSLLILIFISAGAQANKTEVLQNLEGTQSGNQNFIGTATLKSAARLFKDKDDLTSVIMVVPQDSVADVLDFDTAFLHVVYEGNEGYIEARHSEFHKSLPAAAPASIPQQAESGNQPPQNAGYSQSRPKMTRFEYLEKKYGASTAAKLYAGKIWRGMNSQLVSDSWGSPKKINRVISGNVVKEEWIYTDTWLFFQNNTLTDWGPTKRSE